VAFGLGATGWRPLRLPAKRGGGRDAAPEGALADALRRAGLVPKAPGDR